MMDGWKQYLYAVIVCALACGIVSRLLSDSKRKELFRLVCGLVLAISVIRPLSRIRLDDVWEFSSGNWSDSECYIAEGEQLAYESQASCIKASCEAYILDKANELGANVWVDIFLNEDLLPEFAELTGDVAPQVQTQLQRILTTDFGIPKENQKWIRNQESN